LVVVVNAKIHLSEGLTNFRVPLSENCKSGAQAFIP
jgi:hypothetical protein